MPTEIEGSRRLLYVDGDGALLRSELVLECLVEVLRRPAMFWRLPWWFLRGRGYLKRRLAECAHLDVTLLPYDKELLEELRSKAGNGDLRLVTGADEQIARQVAAHLGISQDVVASSPTANVPSGDKRAVLDRKHGNTYNYIPGTRTAPGWKQAIRLLRPYQWLKNTLVFVPFVLAHHIREPEKWAAAILAFLAFSLTASTGYIINDVFDRGQDRLHHRKRFRPIASGAVPLRWALWFPFVSAAAVVACCLFLPWRCAALLFIYFGATNFYSTVAKNRLMADVIMLSLFYTSRLLMGGFATGNTVSPWLLGFSVSLFLSLALCKRISGLITVRAADKEHEPGRKYHCDDIPILEMMAVSSGFMACLIMVLYIQSNEILRLYRHPQFLWFGVIGLLYWIGRLMIFTHRGKCPDDPLLFVLQDRATLFVLGVAAVLGFLAI
jgi:4-hydroxybenzoate polyprenyltransferase